MVGTNRGVGVEAIKLMINFNVNRKTIVRKNISTLFYVWTIYKNAYFFIVQKMIPRKVFIFCRKKL